MGRSLRSYVDLAWGLPLLCILLCSINTIYQHPTLRPISAFLVHQTVNSKCDTPNYRVRLLSLEPLVIHLQDFLTPRERGELQDTA